MCFFLYMPDKKRYIALVLEVMIWASLLFYSHACFSFSKYPVIESYRKILPSCFESEPRKSPGEHIVFTPVKTLYGSAFPLLLGVWEGLRLVIVALPRLFSHHFTCHFSYHTLSGVRRTAVTLEPHVYPLKLKQKIWDSERLQNVSNI